MSKGDGSFAKTRLESVHNSLPAELYGEYLRTGTLVRRVGATTLYKSKDGDYALHDDLGRLHLSLVRLAEDKQLVLELLTYRAGDTSPHPDLNWEVRVTEDWRMVSAVLTDAITFAAAPCELMDATKLAIPLGTDIIDGRAGTGELTVVRLGGAFDDADEAIQSVETTAPVKSRRPWWRVAVGVLAVVSVAVAVAIRRLRWRSAGRQAARGT